MSKPARAAVVDQPTRNDPQGHPFVQANLAVQEAEKLRLARKLDKALSACVPLLKQYPDYVAALHTKGLILADAAQYEDALGCLHRASMLNPVDPKILTALSGIYLRLGANMMAARTLEQAQQLDPKNSSILATLGEIYRKEKEYELSKQAYEAALKIDPSFSTAELGLAQNLIHIGDLEEAAEIYDRHARQGSRTLNVLYTLSQLPASLVSVDVISLLDETKMPARKGIKDDHRAQLAFTKAAAYDKAGRYEEAWAHVSEARRHKYKDNRKAYKDFRKRQAPLLKLARESRLILNSGAEESSELPISLFIAAPSRSGKTTLERLVGSLPGVKRGYENPIIENSVRLSYQTAGFPTRTDLVGLPPGLGELFQKFYIKELKKRAGPEKVLTNTLPARTEDALRVAGEIPNARFIFIKRSLEDISIRIFMRNYKSGNFYASDLRDIREYFTWCHQMIDIQAEKMPDLCRVLTYEEMAADPAAALNMAAELCGLDASGVEIPPIGDDRGCGEPYRDKIDAAVRADDS